MAASGHKPSFPSNSRISPSPPFEWQLPESPSTNGAGGTLPAVRDICHGDRVAARTTVLQQKTRRPVRFEITDQTRDSLAAWFRKAALMPADNLFPSRIVGSDHLSTRQYARIVHSWIQGIVVSIRATTELTQCAARKRL
jgi:hypothetical protein